MTNILCDNHECIHNFKRNDGEHGCACTALKIDDELKCDSYLSLPILKKLEENKCRRER